MSDSDEESKPCSKCGETKPLSAFYWRKERAAYHAHCKVCHRAMARKCEEEAGGAYAQGRKAYYWKTKSTNPRQLDGYGLRYLHHISMDQYDALLARQGGKCAICGTTDPSYSKSGKQRSRMAVDHDHGCCPGNRSCGNCIRGLLCHRCNRALGQMRDDPDILIRATAYLLSYQMKGGASG